MARWSIAAMLLALTPVAESETLTLATCIDIIRGTHPSIAASRERVEASDQDVVTARASFFPRIDASLGSDLWRRSPGQPMEGVIPGTDIEPRTSIGASWSILGVRNPLQYSRSLIERERAGIVHVDTQRDLESHLVTVYYALLQAQHTHALQRNVYSLQQEENRIIQKQVDMGSTSPLQGISGEEALLRTRLSLNQADEARHRAAAELSLLLGKECPSDQPLEDVDTSTLADPGVENEWIGTAQTNREDLAAQRTAVKAADKTVSIALWDRLPDVDVGASYALNPDSFYGTGRIPFTAQSIDRDAAWTFGIGASVPLFAGGALRARHAKAKSSLAQARASLELSRRQVVRDVRSAWAQYRTAHETLLIRNEELRLVKQRTEYIRRLYEAGTRYQAVDWQRARVDVARKEVEVVRAQISAKESWIRLLRAAGLPLNATGPSTEPTREVMAE